MNLRTRFVFIGNWVVPNLFRFPLSFFADFLND